MNAENDDGQGIMSSPQRRASPSSRTQSPALSAFHDIYNPSSSSATAAEQHIQEDSRRRLSISKSIPSTSNLVEAGKKEPHHTLQGIERCGVSWLTPKWIDSSSGSRTWWSNTKLSKWEHNRRKIFQRQNSSSIKAYRNHCARSKKTISHSPQCARRSDRVGPFIQSFFFKALLTRDYIGDISHSMKRRKDHSKLIRSISCILPIIIPKCTQILQCRLPPFLTPPSKPLHTALTTRRVPKIFHSP